MNGRPLVLHLNGVPGAGKSTLARRWADANPGTLLLDVDALRTFVSGWRDDYAATGPRAWSLSFAMIEAYAAEGGDVVIPQLCTTAEGLAGYERAALAGGASFVEVLVRADDAVERFWARTSDEPWLAAVRELVAREPPGHLASYAGRLDALLADRPGVVRLATRTGEVDQACAELAQSLATLGWCPRSPGDGG